MEFYNKIEKQGEVQTHKEVVYNLQAITLNSTANTFEIKWQFNNRQMKQDIVLQKNGASVSPVSQQKYSAFLGILTILDQKFILMVQNVSYVVNIKNNEIFRIDNLAYIPFEVLFYYFSLIPQRLKKIRLFRTVQKKLEKYFFLKQLFSLGFYFSYTYDLTLSSENLD